MGRFAGKCLVLPGSLLVLSVLRHYRFDSTHQGLKGRRTALTKIDVVKSFQKHWEFWRLLTAREYNRDHATFPLDMLL